MTLDEFRTSLTHGQWESLLEYFYYSNIKEDFIWSLYDGNPRGESSSGHILNWTTSDAYEEGGFWKSYFSAEVVFVQFLDGNRALSDVKVKRGYMARTFTCKSSFKIATRGERSGKVIWTIVGRHSEHGVKYKLTDIDSMEESKVALAALENFHINSRRR